MPVQPRVRAEQLIALSPELTESEANLILSVAPEGYLSRFSPTEIARHATELTRLSTSKPFVVHLEQVADAGVSVAIVAFDFPGEFSVLSGVLGSSGMDIQSGAAFTFRLGDSSGTKRALFGPFGPRPAAVLPERRIVDVMEGRLTGQEPFGIWAQQVRETLCRNLSLLFENSATSRNQVKQETNEAVARAMEKVAPQESQKLYPVQITVSTVSTRFTRMSVVTEDTPFFLFALSNALSIQDISIQRVSIHTSGHHVEDEFDFVDGIGQPVTDELTLNRIKLSVLLTKQFTYFFSSAPDPYHALLRFERLAEDVFRMPESRSLQEMLGNPRMLQGLARLLGASDFLWEDFLRVQYENILPMIDPGDRERMLSPSRVQMPALLEREMEKAELQRGTRLTAAEQRSVLNDFKDRQSYLVDVDHILNPKLDFFFLSRRLSGIAELVIRKAVDITLGEITPRFGVPRTVAGLPARFAIFGLGKMGGAALGYASDIEVLFVYSDNGRTDGPEQIPNAEFFERLFSASASSITSKREGIYQVDLRLRPHGNAGPVACSLENFIRYYSPAGEAHSYERLSLVRLRWIGGDETLGRQVERFRNEFVYSGSGIDPKQIGELRKLQLTEKTATGGLNAKFSPGALVDLEYSVQILQVIHGQSNLSLRTPRIHKALEALAAAGTIATDEAARIVHAYRFLRNLINGLRMLRGNAKDLFLPEVNSPEYLHLARRMGYEGRDSLSPAEELHIEFETLTAAIRVFVENHLGREALPGPRSPTIADIVLADTPELDAALSVLSSAGFRNPERSYHNLRSLRNAGDADITSHRSDASRSVVERFAELAVLAWDFLPQMPDPDMALNNWDKLVDALEDPYLHYSELLSQPRRLEVLLQILSASQFLADTLILNPDFFSWATTPQVINSARTREILEADLRAFAASAAPAPEKHDAWLRAIRRFRKREILRIGTRDICLGVDIREITAELSNLAAAIIQTSLDFVWSEQPEPARPCANDFCVLAFGKLGGRELNYSSDVDLLAIYRRTGTEESEQELALYSRVMEQLSVDLSAHNEEGYCYRVDLRLRPYGSSGRLVQSVQSIVRYYLETASSWEFQALLKLSPIAGNHAIGTEFLEEVKPAFVATWDRTTILAAIRQMRDTSALKSSSRAAGRDVKSGSGGIRDIEFAVQGLQLLHSRQHPALLTGNTINAISRLAEANIISSDIALNLTGDYIFLRRVEHVLQLFEDRQVHTLPVNEEARRAFALRCLSLGESDSPNGEDSGELFFERIEQTFDRVHAAYIKLLFNGEE